MITYLSSLIRLALEPPESCKKLVYTHLFIYCFHMKLHIIISSFGAKVRIVTATMW